jgi:DNA-binding transcriptional MerR regulator
LSLNITDLPFLVFGGRCPKTNIELQDAFSKAFSIRVNLDCWKKCGAVPLTRLPLQSKEVRRELPPSTSQEEEEKDPEVLRIKSLADLNVFFCEFLANNGYDGKPLQKQAPKRVTSVAVTEPLSQERIEAIKQAKTAGQLFHATGGRHLNSDEFFKARELKRREEEVAKMEEAKKNRGKYCTDQRDAVLMLRRKGELTYMTEKEFTLAEIKTLLKWKKVKAVSSKKRDMVDAYIAAPKPKIQKVWCNSEEQKLQDLKSKMVPLKDTALGVATNQMARAVLNNLDNLDKESMAAFREAFETKQANKKEEVKEEETSTSNAI